MNTDWIEYKCKSGQTLFIYNKVTGEHKWPTSNSGSVMSNVMYGQPVIYKEYCSTGTQTDDNGCENSCTSMYVATNLVYKDPVISLQLQPSFECRVTNEMVDGDMHGQMDSLKRDNGPKEEPEKKKHFAISEVLEHLKERRRRAGNLTKDNRSRKLDRNTSDFSIGSSIHGRNKVSSHLEIPKIKITQRFTQRQNTPSIQRYPEMIYRPDVQQSMKPFICSWCDKRFPRKGSLKRHLSIHRGERPFQCSYCKREFRHKHHLVKHLKGIHAVYKCSYCELDFQHESALKGHRC